MTPREELRSLYSEQAQKADAERREQEKSLNEPLKAGDRTCLLCAHFSLDFGEVGYSEVTPGSAGEADCDRGVWRMGPNCGSEDEFRRNMRRAVDCQLFEHYREEEEMKSKTLTEEEIKAVAEGLAGEMTHEEQPAWIRAVVRNAAEHGVRAGLEMATRNR